MKRFLLPCSLIASLLLAASAQEKTKTEPKKAAEKGTEKTTEPKKADDKKADDKKADDKKADDKKADDKKPDGKKPADKKPDDKAKPASKDGKPKLEIEVTNLFNPCGVAVQPMTGDVFIADSGKLRVLRYDPTRRIEPPVRVEITGFSKDVYGKGPMYDIGPLGLIFLDQNRLVVGDGGHLDGQELIYFFDVGLAREQSVDNAKHKLGPVGPTPGKTEKGEGNFYALAYHEPTALFFTTNGDDTKGWVAKITLKDKVPDAKIDLAIATKEYTQDVDGPVGITISPDKKLVVGQMGEVTGKGKDSLLLVYDPNTLKPLLKAETGLYDISALAYHPKSKKLYALDYAWEAPAEGGLFRLDVSGEGENAKVKAERVAYTYEGKDNSRLPFAGDPAALDKPTAMAFDGEGNLYITLIGTAKEPPKEAKTPDARKPGRLVRIVGLE